MKIVVLSGLRRAKNNSYVDIERILINKIKDRIDYFDSSVYTTRHNEKLNLLFTNRVIFDLCKL